MFDLVSEGWNSETLFKMPIAERRFYYHKLIEKYSKNKNEPPPGGLINGLRNEKKS